MKSGPINNINKRVIAVQKADDIDVSSEWWVTNVTAVVGNSASEQQMFDAFMTAYDRDFPKDASGKRHPISGNDAAA